MAVSPYRFSIADQQREMKSRTGLSSVTSGAASGGEAYRASALRPGSAGFMASSFGSAPRTDYVKPTPATEAPAEAPKAPETPALAPTYNDPTAAPDRQANIAEGSGGNDIGGDPSGPPGDLGNFGDMNITGSDIGRVGGALLGGVFGGPLGALAGAGLGYLGGKAFDSFQGDGMATGQELGDLGAQAQANVEAMQGSGFGDARGLAQGGYVGPENMHKKPLLGMYAMGGHVPNYAEGGPVDGAALAGPDPAGPDDGFAALDGGEYVVQAAQAQRPDYGPILEAMNAGVYDPEDDDEEGASTEGMMPQEGQTAGDPGALPPAQQQALLMAMESDPILRAALMQLLGPDAAHSLVDSTEPGNAEGSMPMPTGRPPLAGPAPMPGMAAPPGVKPPAKATPTQQMPRPPGLAGVTA